MKIIAVNSPNISNPPDPALLYYSNHVSQWAANASNGWVYLSYVDTQDLVNKLKQQYQTNRQKITELEILAHGNPENCNGIDKTNARNFAIELDQADILSANANVILTGCNTALDIKIYSLPKIIAIFSKRNVLATLGYVIRGSYAEGNTVCSKVNPNTPGVPPMPGASNGNGIYCYTTFNSTI